MNLSNSRLILKVLVEKKVINFIKLFIFTFYKKYVCTQKFETFYKLHRIKKNYWFLIFTLRKFKVFSCLINNACFFSKVNFYKYICKEFQNIMNFTNNVVIEE